MNSGNTPEVILAKLFDLLLLAHAIFDDATVETLGEFAAKKEEIDPFHYPNSVRYNARRRFSKSEGLLCYKMAPLPNNGIEIAYRGHIIKFNKAIDGSPPPAGPSKARAGFYQYNLFAETNNENLVVIWNVSPTGMFLGLDLTCPMGIVSEYQPPNLCWSISVPHPATVEEPHPEFASTEDDLDEIRRNDDEDDALDISSDGTEDL